MGIFKNGWPLRFAALGIVLGGLAAAPPGQDAPPTSSDTTVPTSEATILPASPGWVSPTPDETGAIIVVVQPGDSMWVIAARAGLTLAELLALNSLTEESIINPGDNLIIGYVTPEVNSPEESTPAATLPPPTRRPTATRSEAAICLSAYDDLNRNGTQDAGEPLRAAVAFTLYNTQAVVANYITDGRSEPKCLTGLAPGEYRITRSVSAGEILTTDGDWTLNLAAGSELRQAFGSFGGADSTAAVTADNMQSFPPQTPNSPLPESQPGATPAELGPGIFSPRLAGVIALFLGGLLLLGAVLILIIRQGRNRPGGDSTPDQGSERRFRDIDDLD